MTVYLDIETYSEVPISHGTHAYAESAEVLLVAYAVDQGEVEVWDVSASPNVAPLALISALRSVQKRAERLVIHNSRFDRTVLRHFFGISIPLEAIDDTLARARLHGLPGSLDALCGIFRLGADKEKDKNGKKLINLFCKPRPKNVKIRRATRETHPREWEDFKTYAKRDIEATRELDRRMPRWSSTKLEREIWLLDQRINDRGVAIDRDFVRAAIYAIDIEHGRLADRSAALTGNELTSTRKRDAMLEYLNSAYQVELKDLQANTIERFIEMYPDIPDTLRELLALRIQATTSSTAKYKRLLHALSADGRLRGTLEYCGASRTGRWAGRVFQPQNLPRPTLPAKEIEDGITAIKAQCYDIISGNLMELASSALRGVIVAPENNKLVVSDLSNIEGRVLAWLAGEQWKVKAYSEFDRGSGHDLYKLAYARAFNSTPEKVSKDQRQLGKVMELALGYQGAVGAFKSMAALYGMELPDDTVRVLVDAWRKANSRIRDFWYRMDEAAKIVATGGQPRTVGLIEISFKGSWLRLRLPSGRYLSYASPAYVEDTLTYWGINSYTRKWEQIKTYGGKLVENVTQALARDVMANNMLKVEASGYKIVLSVHDELITETPDTPDYTAAGLSALLSAVPEWAGGLPLAAGGFECTRYRKG